VQLRQPTAGSKLTHQPLEVMLEKRHATNLDPMSLRDLPARKGSRPKTLRGPLHIQCGGHGDRKYVNQLVKDVLSWPLVETVPNSQDPTATIPIRFEPAASTLDSTPWISAREFARVLLGAPTIYLALPLVCAHWAIVQGWAEPHYLGSFGLVPAGTVVVYTPKDGEELGICYTLFSAAYHSAFATNNQPAAIALPQMSSPSSAPA
jgi:hypothetical protein